MKGSEKKIKWRPAVRREMKKAAAREAEAISGEKNPNFWYRWEHVKAVVAVAKKLAKATGADLEIVEAAAWLHDVKKFDSREKHAQDGAKFARAFLPRTDFPPKKIGAVARAISTHMGLWRGKPLKNLEAAILWDADKLTKIGVTAAFHWVGGSLVRKKNSMSTDDLIKMGRRVDWQQKTVKSMHTKPAKQAAAARLQAYNELWDCLEKELKGKDLN
ncbi:MAG: HD domain-containing protein [Ardenticatenaceae bacterium]|nr:HD domain-containing protein [Ardenticatenaceae bacterium]